MDRSLDEIISERPQKQGGRRGERRSRNTSNAPRDGVKKSHRERVDLDRDWVHDRFEDEGDSRSHRRNDRPRRDRDSPDADQPARVRVDNLHYDLTEDDLEGLFGGIGPVTRVRIEFDRAGRSEGVATVTYHHIEDAKRAIREFDGANAKGQQIRLTLLPARGGGASSRAEKSKSLFDRIERPGARNARSLSPSSDGGAGGRRRRRGGGGAGGRGAAGGGSGGGAHRSDVSKPAPENIDRYVPGQRSPVRRNAGGGGGGRRPGERRDEKRRDAAGRGRGGGGGEGGRTAGSGPRPKKTQEELDQEMDDYWGTTNTTTETVTAAAAPAAETVAVESAPAAADDDIDMIE